MSIEKLLSDHPDNKAYHNRKALGLNDIDLQQSWHGVNVLVLECQRMKNTLEDSVVSFEIICIA